MTYQTVIHRTFDEYLRDNFAGGSVDPASYRLTDDDERRARLTSFPHTAVLELSFAELDFANRWCWNSFGPAYGPCRDADSEYPTCSLPAQHGHDGKWQWCWLCKTDYGFGYCEWCFADSEDLRRFVEFIPHINWGEKYPK